MQVGFDGVEIQIKDLRNFQVLETLAIHPHDGLLDRFQFFYRPIQIGILTAVYNVIRRIRLISFSVKKIVKTAS